MRQDSVLQTESQCMKRQGTLLNKVEPYKWIWTLSQVI